MTPLRTYYRGHSLVAMRDEVAGQNLYYHFDHQGTTQALTDSTGTVTDRFASDAGLPPGTSMMLLEEDGTVLLRQPGGQDWRSAGGGRSGFRGVRGLRESGRPNGLWLTGATGKP